MKTNAPRVAQYTRNVILLAQIASRHLVDDPVVLVVQAVRKTPHRAGKTLGRLLSTLPGAGTRALGQQILGAKQLATETKDALATPATNPWARFQHRITAEVAVNYGAVDHLDTSLPPAVRARAAWNAGAVSQALTIASCHRAARSYAKRLAGEAEALDPHFMLTPLPAEPVPSTGAGISVLHLLTNSLPATQSGYTLRSHRLLTSLARTGVQVTAITRIGYPVLVGGVTATDTATVGTIKYRRLLPWSIGRTLPQRLQQTVAETLSAVEGHPIDVVHTTTNYQNALVAQALARSLGVPWVYEVRGIMEETWVSSKKNEADCRIAEMSERFALVRARETQFCLQADAVVTLSQTMKDLLVSRGVPAEKIVLAPNAVEETLFEQDLDPVAAREHLGLPTAGHWVGSVTSVVPYEGLDTLLRAAAILRQSGQDVRVLIAGDGTDRNRLELLATELGLGEHAVFTGRLTPERALIAHQSLDIFVVPRTNDKVCRSVTPLKPIEAMALGRPVVMSDIPPLAELINNPIAPGAGRLFEAENPAALAQVLHEFLADSAARKESAVKGRAFAQTRLWKHNADTLNELYRKILI
ncbi:MAG: glycosyltransferase family 4 protein [Rothia sp. (in: high G+C Gram-positive bacteria)]|nr:glycosyltransferase family 4 protein [Rothia sp. (in: high G+C Gram-positive bacteria)]